MGIEKAPHSNLDNLDGLLSHNTIVKRSDGTEYLKRVPKHDVRAWELILNEYGGVGFMELGCTLRRRTPDEQLEHLGRIASAGLAALFPAFIDQEGNHYFQYFRNAATLDVFLPRASSAELKQVLCDLFEDLRLAHQSGIVYGDRWAENILIIPSFLTPDNTPVKKVLHIDFDLEISGPVASEFEYAQMVFYALCAGRNRTLQLLPEMLAEDVNAVTFNFEAFAHFLKRHAYFFRNDSKYGNSEEIVTNFINSSYFSKRATV